MIEILNSCLIKYDIDYAAYLMIYDLYRNTNHFKNYFLQNQQKLARSNIERGTLTNIFFLINSGLVENSLIDIENYDKHNTETIDIYYKRLKLTEKAKKIIENIESMLNNNSEKIVNPILKKETVEDWIDEYRYKWAKNNKMLKSNAIGNKQTCISKMTEFMKTNPQYTKDVILQATERYIDDFLIQHNYDPTYLITAPYFIKRERSIDGKILTAAPMQLEDYCDLILKEQNNVNNIIAIQENDLA